MWRHSLHSFVSSTRQPRKPCRSPHSSVLCDKPAPVRPRQSNRDWPSAPAGLTTPYQLPREGAQTRKLFGPRPRDGEGTDGVSGQGGRVAAALGSALDREVDDILHGFADRPFIFNLGHGILPDTPVGHVERMLWRIRGAGPA